MKLKLLNVDSFRMKIFIFTLGALLTWGPGSAQAVDWTAANQVTIAWGAVTTLSAGEPIPEGDIINYEVFVVSETGNKEADRVSQGKTPDLQFTITFTEEGRFFVGVRALRLRDAALIGVSTFAWSDNPVFVKDGLTFGIVFFLGPAGPLEMEVLNNAN